MSKNVSIIVYKDEPIDKAIRRFKKMCEKVGIKKQYKAKARYEKPSEQRRREARKAERERRKAVRQQENRYNKNAKSAWNLVNHPPKEEKSD